MKYVITLYSDEMFVVNVAIEYITDGHLVTMAHSNFQKKVIIRPSQIKLEGNTLEKLVEIINSDLECRYRTVTVETCS